MHVDLRAIFIFVSPKFFCRFLVFGMVKRLFVSGLDSFTTTEQLNSYFSKFGELYECVIPLPPRYEVLDYGPDDEKIEARSCIQYEPVINDSQTMDDELDVEKYDESTHGTFQNYMKKIGQGEAFVKLPKKCCAGYAYVTFVNREGFNKCMAIDSHNLRGLPISVELSRDDSTESVHSKRLFVSYFPLERLTAKELKETFGSFGKITDVEFVSDSEGPLHFCIVTLFDAESVDKCVKANHFVRGTRLFVRRAVLRESMKIEEQRKKENASRLDTDKSHGFAGYAFQPQIRPMINPREAIAQGAYSSTYDPSLAAGYAPIIGPKNNDNSEDLLAGYGYGPRKW